MEPPVVPLDVMDVGSGRRLSLAPEAVWMENRVSGGSYVRVRPVPYEEIQAVYSFEQRDWGVLGFAALGWLLLSALLLALAAGLNLNPGWAGSLAVVFILALIFGGLAAYRISQVPRRMLRIDTHTGSLVVPRKHPRFFQTLGQHLEAARKRNPVPPTMGAPPMGAGLVPPFPPPPGPVPGWLPPAGLNQPPAPPPGGYPPPPSAAPGEPPSSSGKAPWEA